MTKRDENSKTELLFIYNQRQKTGSLSCFEIGPPDIREHNKLKAKAQRKQRTIEREKMLFQKEPSTFTGNVLLEKSSTAEDSSVGSCCELALALGSCCELAFCVSFQYFRLDLVQSEYWKETQKRLKILLWQLCDMVLDFEQLLPWPLLHG